MGPRIEDIAEQPYVARRATVTMTTINEIADRLPEIFGWLGARGIAPAGPPFLRYNVIDMAGRLEIEAGVPVGVDVKGEDPIYAGILPAGRYATAVHVGHPEGLIDETAALLAWAAGEGLKWDRSDEGGGERWGCRLEIYNTNPAEQPDMNKWETKLAFRLADGVAT